MRQKLGHRTFRVLLQRPQKPSRSASLTLEMVRLIHDVGESAMFWHDRPSKPAALLVDCLVFFGGFAERTASNKRVWAN